ncbi:hypothetical protein DC28_09775 [Spirochaeta lutea]|uniref:Cupin type-1 domain-containing protein n=1 Tax=Spirochaeta lutea TaxID=1480694 RepID=A0A098QUN6_9SPIO|nr:hypothetical protein DC28_09775 [Spirochaeta lutea]
MTNLILCGGVGSRLWPLSRKLLPKQFARILEGQTLFERTAQRNARFSRRVLIAANEHQSFLAYNQLHNLGIRPAGGLIEPIGRNTAPAIALAAMQCDPGEIILVSPSDHVIADEQAYAGAVAEAADLAAQGYIVTFGIRPEYAETGFGYIQAGPVIVPEDRPDARIAEGGESPDTAGARAVPGEETQGGDEPRSSGSRGAGLQGQEPGDPGSNGTVQGRRVAAFKEKPDLPTAEGYLRDGNFFWNSGMFCFQAGVFLKELETYQPEMYRACRRALEGAGKASLETRGSGEAALTPRLEDMQAIPALSVDYAVMEQTRRAAVVPCSIGWSDLGSLDALFDFLGDEARQRNPEAENVWNSDLPPVAVESRGNLVIAGERQVALIDVEDLYVIETPDALLVGRRGSSQKVKAVVQHLEETAPRFTERFPTVERPWGRYTTLHQGEGYMVRRIQIKPGGKTSLQRHRRREELWTVASGQARVRIELSVRTYQKGQSIEVPRGAWHQLENSGTEPLIIIETQIGNAISEDDVERREG